MSPAEHLEAETRVQFFADTIGKEPPACPLIGHF